VPVLPVGSLLAVAEEARHGGPVHADQGRIVSLLDARMGEMYAGTFALSDGRLQETSPAVLVRPQDLAGYLVAQQSACAAGTEFTLAGNVFDPYARLLDVGLVQGLRRITALPTALAMLRLAPYLLEQGLTVPPELALPVYVRDKVARTTEERAADKAAVQEATA